MGENAKPSLVRCRDRQSGDRLQSHKYIVLFFSLWSRKTPMLALWVKAIPYMNYFLCKIQSVFNWLLTRFCFRIIKESTKTLFSWFFAISSTLKITKGFGAGFYKGSNYFRGCVHLFGLARLQRSVRSGLDGFQWKSRHTMILKICGELN